jgi:hypothetical protein
MAPRNPKPVRSSTELAELRTRAKELYFTYVPHNDIAKELGVSAATVADWRKKEGWDIEREGIERGILEDSFGARRMSLSRITKMTTELLEKGLKHFSDRVDPPTLAEAEKLSIIIGNLDKILRLDMGKATDNIQVAASVQHTVEDVRARLALDPVLGHAIALAGAPKILTRIETQRSQQPELPDD